MGPTASLQVKRRGAPDCLTKLRNIFSEFCFMCITLSLQILFCIPTALQPVLIQKRELLHRLWPSCRLQASRNADIRHAWRLDKHLCCPFPVRLPNSLRSEHGRTHKPDLLLWTVFKIVFHNRILQNYIRTYITAPDCHILL